MFSGEIGILKITRFAAFRNNLIYFVFIAGIQKKMMPINIFCFYLQKLELAEELENGGLCLIKCIIALLGMLKIQFMNFPRRIFNILTPMKGVILFLFFVYLITLVLTEALK